MPGYRHSWEQAYSRPPDYTELPTTNIFGESDTVMIANYPFQNPLLLRYMWQMTLDLNPDLYPTFTVPQVWFGQAIPTFKDRDLQKFKDLYKHYASTGFANEEVSHRISIIRKVFISLPTTVVEEKYSHFLDIISNLE